MPKKEVSFFGFVFNTAFGILTLTVEKYIINIYYGLLYSRP